MGKDDLRYIGWCCTYLPLELIEALGLIPYRLLPEPGLEERFSLLDPNLCPYVRSVSGTIEDNKNIMAVVLLNSCDGMRRLFDAISLSSNVPCFLLDLPRRAGHAEICYFRECLEELARWLEGISGRRLEKEALFEAIAEANETRSLLQALIRQGAKASVLFQLVRESFSMPRKAFKERLKHVSFEPSQEEFRVKLLLTGSVLEIVPLIEFIEALRVHLYTLDLCTGLRRVERVEMDDDPFFCLSRAYLRKSPCARMVGGLREDYLETLIGQVQGVIYYVPKFCDPYLYSLLFLRRVCRMKGVPMLVLEGDYSGRVTAGMRTRVEAFVERWIQDG